MNWYKTAQMEGLKFENNHIDHHNGQDDYNLLAKLNGESVGIIEYSEYRDEIFLNNMLVRPSLRRQKIATKMMMELKRLYPNSPIHWGIMSDAGFGLKQSLEQP